MKNRPHVLPAIVLTVCLALGAIFTGATVHLENRAATARFERIADLVEGRLSERINQHIALLQATNSYHESLNGDLPAHEFSRFVSSLGLNDRYGGIQGIGFAALLPRDRAAEGAAMAQRNYGVPVTIQPQGTLDHVAPVVLLEPMDERNQRALGYDMFAEPMRRAAMLDALDSGAARASGPVELVQEITSTKQIGFNVYLPTRVLAHDATGATAYRVSGFVYAPFRAGDLHQAALIDPAGVLPVTIRTVDVAQPEVTLYASDTQAVTHPRTASRLIEVAGRTWRIDMAQTAGFAQWTDHLPGMIVAALSLLLTIAAMLVVRGMQRSLAAAHMSAEMSRKMAQERALMLQEMKHRIKNHIARIQAIARHTASCTDDLDEFEALFSSRLRAMADAQDLLTGGGGDRADLAELISKEIGQIMGREGVKAALDGPVVRLDARQSQAMGLVTHELTTNAMKYGSTSSGAHPSIRVRWRVTQDGAERLLHLDWHEPGARQSEKTVPPSRRGFGTQLLEVMVEGELRGTLVRHFDADGLAVQIRFPLAA